MGSKFMLLYFFQKPFGIFFFFQCQSFILQDYLKRFIVPLRPPNNNINNKINFHHPHQPIPAFFFSFIWLVSTSEADFLSLSFLVQCHFNQADFPLKSFSSYTFIQLSFTSWLFSINYSSSLIDNTLKFKGQRTLGLYAAII